MKKIATVIFILITIFYADVQAQNWAGPDKATCGEKGVMIGSSDACNGCCFSWSPAEGLSDAHIKNPIARPKKPTWYTVTVVDENLSWKKTDKVFVDLSFGEFIFEPDHLEQGSDEIALVRLKNNIENHPTTWSLPDPLGCTIEPSGDPNLASIHPGNQYGKLLVKVQNANDAECYFTDYIPVNNGVKDLIVKDLNNPERMAKTGETLYLVGLEESEVIAKLIAIPNEGGFANGNPMYHPNFTLEHNPINGEDEQEVTEEPTIALAGGNTAVYQAGESPDYEPEITVVRIHPAESSVEALELFQNMMTFLQEWKDRFDFENLDLDAQGPPPGPECPSQDPFDVNWNFGLVFKGIEVEKYNSPALGTKRDLSLDFGVHIAGRIYHPTLTCHCSKFGVGICSEVFAGVDLNQDFHLSMTSDQSLADPSYKLNDPQLEIVMTGLAGFNITLLSGLGIDLIGQGSATVSTKLIFEYKTETGDITAAASLAPITLKIEAAVVNETNMGEFEPVFNLISEEVVLFKGYPLDPIVLYHPLND